MRILIFGAGVIGSLYGALLAEADTMYPFMRRHSACCPRRSWDGYLALCFKAPSGIGSCTGIR